MVEAINIRDIKHGKERKEKKIMVEAINIRDIKHGTPVRYIRASRLIDGNKDWEESFLIAYFLDGWHECDYIGYIEEKIVPDFNPTGKSIQTGKIMKTRLGYRIYSEWEEQHYGLITS